MQNDTDVMWLYFRVFCGDVRSLHCGFPETCLLCLCEQMVSRKKVGIQATASQEIRQHVRRKRYAGFCILKMK